MLSPQKLTNLTFLAIASLLPAMAQRVYNCGNLNQPSCGIDEFERTNMVAGQSRSCEIGLKKVDGVCRNDNRDTTFIRNNFLWAGWALENQTMNLGRDLPINFLTWPTAHNSYSSARQGFDSFLYANQELSITDQLNAGVRALELDPKYYFTISYPLFLPTSDAALRLCHAKSVALCALPGYGNRLFGMALQEIAAWSDANRSQVLYIKLDNKDLGNAIDIVEQEVSTYLGHRVYRVPPGSMTRWPTIREIRGAGKRIIVVRHNPSETTNGNWLWSASGFLQSSNHPKDQDFRNCRAYDGMGQIERGKSAPLSWWDTAEGRAITNTGDADTGLFWEENVRQAAECGVAQIGLDFINALDSSLNLEGRSTPDRRLEAMVWSWAENDFGRAGPASMNSVGRWSSINAANALPLACAAKVPYGSTLQDRQWRITAAEVPWNEALGDSTCAAEFGTNYEFAFPRNGLQNKELKTLAAGRRLWLRYSNVATPELTFSSTSLTFRMNPNGNLPARQTVRIGANPGTLLTARLNTSIPVSFQLPANALATGIYDFPVDILPAASNLASGTYNTSITFSVANVEEFVLPVTLVVRAAPSISSFAEPPTARRASNVKLFVKALNATRPTGEFKIYRIADASGARISPETVGIGQMQVTSADSGEGSVTLNNLPLGTHSYAASYFGDQSNLPDDSSPFQITITERIVPSPTSLSFRLTPGQQLTSQSVSLVGLGSNPAATPACDWLKTDFSGTTLRVLMADPIRNLAAGSYNCNVVIRDALTGQGFGQLDLPVQLAVLTTFNTQPVAPIEVTGGGFSDATVAASNGSSIPFTATPLQSWLRVELLDNTVTPARLRIHISGNDLPLGVYRGQVRISSPLAADANFEVVFNRVNTSVITTLPAGLPVVVDGATRQTPFRVVWAPNTPHSVSFPEFVENGVRYRARSWTLNGNVSPGNTFNFSATREGFNLVANLDLDYRLTPTVTPSNGGSLVIDPMSPDGFYPAGASVTITAVPAANFVFNGWFGSTSVTTPTTQLVMSAPRSVMASFSEVRPVRITLTSNAFGAAVWVNGSTLYNLPAILSWIPGRSYTLTPSFPLASLDARTVFDSWSNGGAQTQTIVAPDTPMTLTMNTRTEFFLRLQSSPSAGGTVSGGGWYTAGANASIEARAASGFSFSGFSGDLVSTNSSATVSMSAPRNIVANFTPAPIGTPSLVLASAGPRTDGQAPNERLVPISIANRGTGTASGVEITGISDIRVTGGSGLVERGSVGPISYGDLAPGASAIRNLSFIWPPSALRVQLTFTVLHSTGVPGQMTLNLLR